MTAPPLTPWEIAQEAERNYWYPTGGCAQLTERRTAEREFQAWCAGLLGIPDAGPASVLEIGAGPQGLLTRYGASAARKIAVEPMRLTIADAERYASRNVERHEMPIELWHARNGDIVADEVWMANVLQHVHAPGLVLAIAAQHSSRRVRIFEWVDEPVSVVHLHTVRGEAIDHAFARWGRLVHGTDGTATTGDYRQRFIARVFERRAV